MKKMALLVCILMIIVISGCATDQGNTGVYEYEKPSGYQGHHH